jgi:hypothetical protein
MRHLRLTDEEQAERFVSGEAGQPSLVAVHQFDAAARAAGRKDRNACFAERLDVAQDRPLRDLERARQLSGRRPTAPLEHQQHVEHTRGAHPGESGRT